MQMKLQADVQSLNYSPVFQIIDIEFAAEFKNVQILQSIIVRNQEMVFHKPLTQVPSRICGRPQGSNSQVHLQSMQALRAQST